MLSLKVDKKNDGKKLITYITSLYPNLNVNTLYKSLRKKDIRINGKRINENLVIHQGDELIIYVDDSCLKNDNSYYTIVFEDENILIVNKSYNIEVTGVNSLTSLLKKEYSYIEPCHRIDRNTTGLVLFAKNEISLNILLKCFKNNEIEKHYITLCYGIPNKKTDTFNDYLFKDNKKSMVYISDVLKKGYVKISTSYTLLDYSKEKNISLLDIELHTGKTHQIRAHLAHYNLPIIGDGKYGINTINKSFKRNKQALCSYSLTFHFSENNDLKYLNNKVFKLNNIPFKEYL